MNHVTHVGRDVHKDTIVVAFLRRDPNVPEERVIPNTPEALRKLLGRRRGSVVAPATRPARPATRRTGSWASSAFPATSSPHPHPSPRAGGQRPIAWMPATWHVCTGRTSTHPGPGRRVCGVLSSSAFGPLGRKRLSAPLMHCARDTWGARIVRSPAVSASDLTVRLPRAA
jgi:hypothetical protein